MKLLIERKTINTSPGLAKKLKVSERTILLMIDFAEKNGDPIRYCGKAKIYSLGYHRQQLA